MGKTTRPAENRRVDILAHPLFEGADRDVVAPLVSGVSAREVDGGQMLARPEGQSCLLVFEGALLSYVLLPDGRRILFEVIRPGGVEGVLNVAVEVEGHFSEAAEQSVVAPLDRRTLDALMDAEPVIGRTLMRLTLSRLHRREAQLQAVIHHEATRRVASMLLTLMKYTGRPSSNGKAPLVEIVPRPTHQVLADMVGLRRETVTIEMGRLRQTGAIRVAGSTLVLNQELLTNVVENEIPRRISALLEGGGR